MRQKSEFFIKAPSGDRRSFAIVRRLQRYPKTKNETVRSEAVETVNRLFQEGTYTKAQARKALEAEIERLRSIETPEDTKPLSGNLRILERYWKSRYQHRDIVAKDAAYHRLKRAILALGQISLSTASQQSLQNHINKLALDLKDSKQRSPGKNQRETAAVLNQLLRFINRNDVKLVGFRKPRRRVKYLTEAELAVALEHIDDELFKDLACTAFGTGMRLGECFAATPANFIKSTSVLWVEYQIDDEFQERETKNRRPHHAPVIPSTVARLESWLNRPHSEKMILRDPKIRHAKILREACKKAFKDPSKHVGFHDLRHSYAIHLLSKGVSLENVAKSIGDSIQVAQEYYLGFTLNAQDVQAVAKMLAT